MGAGIAQQYDPKERLNLTHLTPIEYKVIYYIQRFDDILVMLLPWLKWLAVVGFSVCTAGLHRWNVKRRL